MFLRNSRVFFSLQSRLISDYDNILLEDKTWVTWSLKNASFLASSNQRYVCVTPPEREARRNNIV